MAQSELDDHAEPKYKDEEWLREQYLQKEKSTAEIGDQCGVSKSHIFNWLVKYDIDRRSNRDSQTLDGPHTDEDWLREKYIEEGLSSGEIGDVCDVSSRTILSWINHFDIPTRNGGCRTGRKNHSWVEYSHFYTNNIGYEISVNSFENSRYQTTIHRLAVVAWFGYDSVVEKDVHHRIPIPWLNIESNLHPLSKQEHAIISGKYGSDGVPEEVVDDVLDGLGE